MRVRAITRLLATAVTVSLAAAARPALGQVADVVVTVTVSSASSGHAFDAGKTYAVKLTNNGPSHVTDFILNAVFTPPAVPYDAAISVTPPAGCAPTTVVTPPAVPPKFPCRVTLASPLVNGGSATVNVVATVPTPAAPLPTAPADCPTAATLVHSVIDVPEVRQGTTNVDPDYTNNDATQDIQLRQWTDLAVDNLSVPGNTSEGQALVYSEDVTNYGPCAATGAFVNFTPPASLTWVSATACDNAGTFIDADENPGCALGGALGIPVGSTLSYTVTYTVNTFPNEVIRAAIPVDTEVAWDFDIVSGPDPEDPTHASAASTSTTVDLSDNEGCSTGGVGTLFGLLSLVALRFGRRRSS